MSLHDLISDRDQQRRLRGDYTERVLRFTVYPEQTGLAAEALDLQGTLFAFVRIRIKEETYEEQPVKII